MLSKAIADPSLVSFFVKYRRPLTLRTEVAGYHKGLLNMKMKSRELHPDRVGKGSP